MIHEIVYQKYFRQKALIETQDTELCAWQLDPLGVTKCEILPALPSYSLSSWS